MVQPGPEAEGAGVEVPWLRGTPGASAASRGATATHLCSWSGHGPERGFFSQAPVNTQEDSRTEFTK